MKIDGVGISNPRTPVGPTHGLVSFRKAKTTSVCQASTNRTAADLLARIERADHIAANVSKKLHDMSKILNVIPNEQNDAIREKLARLFNVLRAYIEETLHPTGDWSTDRIMSGKTINVNRGVDGTIMTVHGEKITMGSLEINKLSRTPTGEELETFRQHIKQAEASVGKLRNNLASARSQAAHLSKESIGLSLHAGT